MKKKKKIYLILLFTLVFFTMSLVKKGLQNDTFFYIPIGERIVKTHEIDGIDHWSIHENLRFTYPGWICDVIMYLLYNSFGFTGIYCFVMIISSIISIVVFNTLIKQKNGIVISFLISLLIIWLLSPGFTARNQIFSYLIFALEIQALEEFLTYGKKKYFWVLLVLAFLLVNFHDTVFPLFFVFILPYLAEIFFQNVLKYKDTDKIKFSNLKNGKLLVLLIILSFIVGFFTPVFGTAYTNLINCMNGSSTTIINELLPLGLFDNYTILTILFTTFSILVFTKTKVKIKDLLFVIGLILFALMVKRNLAFLFFIGIVFFSNIVRDFLKTYINNFDEIIEKLDNNNLLIVVICCSTLILSIDKFSEKMFNDYVDEYIYPVKATEYILKNVDYKDAKIWTSFNWGSYLELNGIKVFIDSRSGMYTEQENPGCSVLDDWFGVDNGILDCEEIFKKYGITHVLVNKNNAIFNKINDVDDMIDNIDSKISNNEKYKKLYEDSYFCLYEIVTDK